MPVETAERPGPSRLTATSIEVSLVLRAMVAVRMAASIACWRHYAILTACQSALLHAQMTDGLPDSLIPYDEIVQERSEEHTSELQSLMRISYAVFCLKKKRKTNQYNKNPIII